MILSYPIQSMDAEIGDAARDKKYADTWFPDPAYGSGAYPLSAHLRWHGGVHLRYGAEPIRAIADGKVVFVRTPAVKNANSNDPLNYGSGHDWTDNGCVVIEHTAETGKNTHVTFWSVSMHLKTVKVQFGKEVDRKDVLGTGGEIAGVPAIHFEIFTSQDGVDALIKRADQPYKVFSSADNSGDPDLWGDMHFIVPTGAAVFDHSPEQSRLDYEKWKQRKQKHDQAEHKRIQALVAAAHHTHTHPDPAALHAQPFQDPAPAQSTPRQIGTTDKTLCVRIAFLNGTYSTASFTEGGSAVGEATERDAQYEYEMSALSKLIAPASQSAAYELVRYGRVVGEDALDPADAANWKYIAWDTDKKGYVNLNVAGVVKLSDADFPAFLGWQRVPQGAKGTASTSDGRCDAKAVLDLLRTQDSAEITDDAARAKLNDAAVRNKLRRLVCEFQTEWEDASFDQTYDFLLKDGTWGDNSPRAAMTRDQYAQFKAHALALQWWSTAALGLPSKLWHFHPIEFITWMRKCGWIDKRTLARIYPRTPEATRERYRTALNQVMQKYVFTTPLRQAHFLGQGAVESGSLMSMQEASMLNGRKNPKSEVSEAQLGHWYGRDAGESDSFFSSDKVNSLGTVYAGSYSWMLGNVGDVDAQKYRGRGFKQLTGRSNYAEYWVYRGWLKKTDFDASWWTDHAYKQHQPEQMTKRPAPIEDPDRVISSPFNCIDSGGFFVAYIRSDIKEAIDKGSPKIPVSHAQVDALKNNSLIVSKAINGKGLAADARYSDTLAALKVLN
ncbi:hypothetical protein [Paraburkholderia sp. BR10882]|uniref:hypothetical protein n=1 Tax=unclassified Paraburkholderia TaxID=2615204 RepID=UPI0034CD0B51